jgi:hypothetical protein
MNKVIKYIIWISGILLVTATIGMFNMDKLYSPIVFFISLNALLFGLAWVNLRKMNSNRLIGFYLILTVIIYDLINYEPIWGFESIFLIDFEHWACTVRTFLTLVIFAIGIYYLIKGGEKEITFKRTDLKILLALILCLLIFEVPIYNLHGDFGGSPHGHNLIDGFHFH